MINDKSLEFSKKILGTQIFLRPPVFLTAVQAGCNPLKRIWVFFYPSFRTFAFNIFLIPFSIDYRTCWWIESLFWPRFSLPNSRFHFAFTPVKLSQAEIFSQQKNFWIYPFSKLFSPRLNNRFYVCLEAQLDFDCKIYRKGNRIYSASASFVVLLLKLFQASCQVRSTHILAVKVDIIIHPNVR